MANGDSGYIRNTALENFVKGALAPLAASEGISYSLRFSSALTSDPAWHGPVHWIYYQCRCTCGGPRVRTFRTWPGRALAKLKNWGVRQGSCRLLCSSRGSCLNFLTCFDCHSCPRPQYVGYEMLALAAGVFLLLLFCAQKRASAMLPNRENSDEMGFVNAISPSSGGAFGNGSLFL